MMNISGFGVIGGDKRQIFLSESIAADGYTVYACGFDRAEFSSHVRKADYMEAIRACSEIILPLPVTLDGETLNTPYSENKIYLNDEFAALMRGKHVYGGMMGKLLASSPLWEEISTFDYFAREELAVRNAVPTAEGSIEIAMREYSGTVCGSRCLVAGFGRIGKVLSVMLRGMGADVTASARKNADLAWIEVLGLRSVRTESIFDEAQYDLVFNTIPAPIFTRKVLAKAHPDTILIDLASAPGGVDLDAAKKIGIKAVTALSLPGRVAPKAAGEIIKSTIYNIIGE